MKQKLARKHILYIESAAAVRLYPRWHQQMLEELNKLFVVSWGLDNGTHAAVEECMKRGGPNGIVSNAGGLRSYALDQFRLQEAVPIVAFTGAQARDLIPIYTQADIVLLKKANIAEDIRQIHDALTSLWKRHKIKPPPPPDIRTEAGHTSTTAVVRLSGGLGLMGSVGIFKECKIHQRAITFARLEGSEAADTCFGSDSPMALMRLELFEGVTVRITVEGADTDAERIVRRLYGALTSRYECLLRMDRFEAPAGGYIPA